MNQSSAQAAVRQAELGDQVAKLWEARFAGSFHDAPGPRRWDPESAFDPGTPECAAGTVVVPSRELAGRRSFDNRGRGRRVHEAVRLVLEAMPRPSMTFAPYLLA